MSQNKNMKTCPKCGRAVPTSYKNCCYCKSEIYSKRTRVNQLLIAGGLIALTVFVLVSLNGGKSESITHQPVPATPATAKKWFQKGTLHQAKVSDWKKATTENKLATSADWLAATKWKGALNSPDNFDRIKKQAHLLILCIDKSVENSVDTLNVSEVAAAIIHESKYFYPSTSFDVPNATQRAQPAHQNTSWTSVENEIRAFAERKYPNDTKMQAYIYKKQITAYNYMQRVSDDEIRSFTERKYYDDYTMQKYTYNKQLSSKKYMAQVTNSYAENKAKRQYPYDYVMQKYIYDKEAF